MRRSVYTQWLRQTLFDAANGKSGKTYENPAAVFVRDAKAGCYDTLSDEEYEALSAETEELAAAWRSRASCASGDVLRALLKKAQLNPDRALQLAEMAADWFSDRSGPFDGEDAFGKHAGEANLPYAKRPDAPGNAAGRSPELLALYHPRRVYAYLTSRVYGQREALHAAAMLMYHHACGRKRNLLFAGPTGCGKAEIWRALGDLCPDVRIIDSTQLTMQGWAGGYKLRDVFAGMDAEGASHAIIVFDEFDKFCEPKVGTAGSNYSASAQSELLKLIEGGEMHFPEEHGKPALTFDSSRVSFVFCGSFEQLIREKQRAKQRAPLGFGREPGAREPDGDAAYREPLCPEDLVQFAGVRQEIAGRIQQIVQLHPLTERDYRAMLDDPALSPLRRLEREHGVTLRLSDTVRAGLVEQTVRSHMGVRYLYSRLQQMLDDAMFLDCARPEYELRDAPPVYI